MPNKKVPGRDEFEAARLAIVEHLPSNYGGLILHRRRDIDKRRLYHVKCGKVVDWDILSELQKLAKEEQAARKLQPLAA
jgi:hypothetical protein